MKEIKEGEYHFSLYQGKVTGKFLDKTDAMPFRHMYYVDGDRKTSVSTINKSGDKSNFMIPWALEEAAKHLITVMESGKKVTLEDVVKAVFASDNAKNKAADLGTRIHSWIEAYVNHKVNPKNNPMPEMPEDKNEVTGVLSFLEWESSHKVKFLWAEKFVYSKKHDYIGQADFGAIVDGKKCLCDNKTGNGLYDDVLKQTAAYVHADEEESGEKYDGRWVIRIAKESEDEYHERLALKNRIKAILGKKEKEIEPYQVFEAVYLDKEGTEMKRDFKAFLASQHDMIWRKEVAGFNKA